MFPFENLHASKAGRFDETILLDSEYTRFLGPFWRRLASQRPGAPLWGVRHQAFLLVLRRCFERLGILWMHAGLYPLRHGGASHDALFRLRPLSNIQDRGRWGSSASLVRYQKLGKAQAQYQQLPDAVRLLVEEVHDEELLGELFHFPQRAAALLRKYEL